MAGSILVPINLTSQLGAALIVRAFPAAAPVRLANVAFVSCRITETGKIFTAASQKNTAAWVQVIFTSIRKMMLLNAKTGKKRPDDSRTGV